MAAAVMAAVLASTTIAAHALSAQNMRWGRCVVGVSYGAPFKMAVSYAAGRVWESEDGGGDYCDYVSTKVGIGGARLALGSSRTINALGGAAGLSVGLLRTFGNPWHAQPWSNHLGVAIHVLPALALGGELGYYVRVGGDAPGAPKRGILTWSVGFGF
jgi:hypothetical protein